MKSRLHWVFTVSGKRSFHALDFGKMMILESSLMFVFNDYQDNQEGSMKGPLLIRWAKCEQTYMQWIGWFWWLSGTGRENFRNRFSISLRLMLDIVQTVWLYCHLLKQRNGFSINLYSFVIHISILILIIIIIFIHKVCGISMDMIILVHLYGSRSTSSLSVDKSLVKLINLGPNSKDCYQYYQGLVACKVNWTDTASINSSHKCK